MIELGGEEADIHMRNATSNWISLFFCKIKTESISGLQYCNSRVVPFPLPFHSKVRIYEVKNCGVMQSVAYAPLPNATCTNMYGGIDGLIRRDRGLVPGNGGGSREMKHVCIY